MNPLPRLTETNPAGWMPCLVLTLDDVDVLLDKSDRGITRHRRQRQTFDEACQQAEELNALDKGGVET